MRRIIVMCLLAAAFLSVVGCGAEDTPVLQIYCLDVGQGDCTLLRTEAGDVLIDAGTEDSQELLCLRLEALGVERLSLLVLSHGDEDHIGGADGVLSRIPTERVWINGELPDTQSAELLRRAAETSESPLYAVSAGEQARVGELILTVLAPTEPTEDGGNEASIILRAQFREIGAIFSGDAGVEEEEALLARVGAAQLDCEFYKVGHHGSNTSSGDAFVKAMSPEYAVISCGADNSFGHPTGAVLLRLERYCSQVLRTDLSGELLFVSDGQDLQYCEATGG